jgi:hypothetical protein
VVKISPYFKPKVKPTQASQEKKYALRPGSGVKYAPVGSSLNAWQITWAAWSRRDGSRGMMGSGVGTLSTPLERRTRKGKTIGN